MVRGREGGEGGYSIKISSTLFVGEFCFKRCWVRRNFDTFAFADFGDYFWSLLF